MTVGLDAVIVSKALAPLILQLAKGATGTVGTSLKKWEATNFSKKLAKKLVAADKIKTIWAPDKETSLLSIYYPSKITCNNVIKHIDSLAELPDGNIVIEGIVGHGKSMFLRYLFLQELAGKGSNCLPVFIELRTLTEKRDLEVHIREALERMEISARDDVCDYLLRSGRLVLLLDGFDELDVDLVSLTIHKLESLIEKYDDLRVVVTSRPSADIQKSRLFSTVSLFGLRKEDYKPFLDKLGVQPVKILEIVEAIRKSPSDVSNLITTPLMMTLLVMVYESEHEIPSELPEFFEKLFVTMFSRHDKQKAGFNRKHYSGLSERKLQLLFEIFCFITIKQKYGRSLSSEQFNVAFDSACRHSSNIQCDVENFRKDIVKVACLMIEEGFDLTTFLHKSIAEYFAAAFVWRSSDEFAERFYASAVTNYDAWKSVLTFLEKIDAYRFAKYYGVVTRKALINELKLTSASVKPVSVWVEYFKNQQPAFGVTFLPRTPHGSKKSSEKTDDFFASEFGIYTNAGSYGGQISNRLVHVIMDGMQLDLPSSMREEELKSLSPPFSRVEKSESAVGYRIMFSNAIAEYGTAGIAKKAVQFELEIWRELEEMEALIKAEDDKKAILEDDLI